VGRFFEMQIKGTFCPFSHASERIVYKGFQSSTSSDKRQGGFEEIINFCRRKRAKILRTTNFLNTFSQYTKTEIKQQHDIMKY